MRAPVESAEEAERIARRLWSRGAERASIGARVTAHEVGWAVVPVATEGGALFGGGATIVTRAGLVYAGGSGQPVAEMLEDVLVLTGGGSAMARLRHGWRSIADRIRVTRVPDSLIER